MRHVVDDYCISIHSIFEDIFSMEILYEICWHISILLRLFSDILSDEWLIGNFKMKMESGLLFELIDIVSIDILTDVDR